jgi:uncharacterized protein
MSDAATLEHTDSSGLAASRAARLDFIDAVRGFALFGVFGANLFLFSGVAYMSDSQRAALPTPASDRVVQTLELIFVENKFMGLFAFLFGASFWLFLNRGERGAQRESLFRRRLAWLFAIGALHGWLFWCFDILRFYALWGFLLPPFLRASKLTLFASALLCAVLAPAIDVALRARFATPQGDSGIDAEALRAFSTGSFLEAWRVNWRYDWYLTLSIGQIAYQIAVFGRLLLGLFAARTLLAGGIDSHRALLRKIAGFGLLSGITGNALVVLCDLDSHESSSFASAFGARLLIESSYLALSLGYAAAVALLARAASTSRRTLALAPIGRMALSWYLAQSAFGIWFFYAYPRGPNRMGHVGPTQLAAIWIAGFALQAWLARIWFARFRFGPAEWAWRSLTHGRMQPFRR